MSTEGGSIRIMAVDDHSLVLEGIATFIAGQPDMRLVAEASNGREAIHQFREHRPDVTLMDLQLPGANGTDVLIAIRGEFPRARIVILTTSDSDGEIQRAMRAGAAAYLLKSMPKAQRRRFLLRWPTSHLQWTSRWRRQRRPGTPSRPVPVPAVRSGGQRREN